MFYCCLAAHIFSDSQQQLIHLHIAGKKHKASDHWAPDSLTHTHQSRTWQQLYPYEDLGPYANVGAYVSTLHIGFCLQYESILDEI